MAKIRVNSFLFETTRHFHERLGQRNLAGLQALRRVLGECYVINPLKAVRPGDRVKLYHSVTNIVFWAENILANKWVLATLYLIEQAKINRWEQMNNKKLLAQWQPRYKGNRGLQLIQVEPQPIPVKGETYLLPVDPDDLDRGGLHFRYPMSELVIHQATFEMQSKNVPLVFEGSEFVPGSGRWELVRVDQVWYWKELESVKDSRLQEAVYE